MHVFGELWLGNVPWNPHVPHTATSQIRPRPFTASRSSTSSATEASIRPRENSSISRPWMISYEPPEQRTGNDEMMPSGTPYEPSDGMAIEVHSVPVTQS